MRTSPQTTLQHSSQIPDSNPATIRATDNSQITKWEAAYLRFESPDEEVRKFTRRLLRLGVSAWPKGMEIVELFCGRGNGLHALHQLGFARVEGLDISAPLLAKYQGPSKCHLADSRHLPFANCSKDLLIVQGGLHHLQSLPSDLEQTLSEIHRVLRNDGRLLVVEPWLTPFLSLVHFISRNPYARRLSGKLDAFATMTENEWVTYEQWLKQPTTILVLFERFLQTEQCSFRWGKIVYVGSKAAAG